MQTISIIATMALASGAVSLLCLLILHFTSTEYQPSWRMVSEYALGKHKWLLTVFFMGWGICSMLTAYLLWQVSFSLWAQIGSVLVLLSGIGAFMGGLFDVKHKWHGMAFGLGIPTLPIGALLLSYHLVNMLPWSQQSILILWSAHALWITVVLMAVSMMVLFAGFKKAGLPMGPDVEPPEHLPAGVIGIVGYANRLLVLCYVGWLLIMAKTFMV